MREDRNHEHVIHFHLYINGCTCICIHEHIETEKYCKLTRFHVQILVVRICHLQYVIMGKDDKYFYGQCFEIDLLPKHSLVNWKEGPRVENEIREIEIFMIYLSRCNSIVPRPFFENILLIQYI